MSCPKIVAGQDASSSSLSGWTIERFLRGDAIKTVKPVFPPDALHNHVTGVAVVEIVVNERGRVSSTHMLEAPSVSVADAVTQAITLWQFKPFTQSNGMPALVTGKLTFYFEINDGKGLVLDPSEAGYVGLRPDKSKDRKKKEAVGTAF